MRRIEKRFLVKRTAGVMLAYAWSGALQCACRTAGNRFHHSQARFWFGSATPNDHALRVLQVTALRPLRDQTVPGGPLEWDAAPYPRLAALMKNNSRMRASRRLADLQFPL
jgi:hypothetical protein